MRCLVVVAVVACSSQKSPPTAPVPPSPTETHAYTLADLGWIVGTWEAPKFSVRWENIAGALYGISLHDRGFEVSIIDDSDDDGKPAPIAMVAREDGKNPTRLDLVNASTNAIDLAGGGATVNFTKVAGGMTGTYTHPPGAAVSFEVKAAKPGQAAELEAIDRAFEADTAKDGADGWVRYFAANGAMGDPRIEGPDAIRASIAKRLARGPLRWKPVASGVRGDIGFTLGTWTFGEPAVAHGSYSTIWAKQPDGSWKIIFDIGRVAQ